MKKLLCLFLTICLLFTACGLEVEYVPEPTANPQEVSETVSAFEGFSLETLPDYSGEPYVVLQNNVPNFTEADLNSDAYEYYSPLDELGRCGEVMACIGQELMPTEERGSIGQVKPAGWKTVKYDFVDGKYLYNRCHLIGFQLTGENANEENLITGTRYLNVQGMLPFENMVADYIKETDNHVVYRVTPIYDGDDLVAKGVIMEAKSVEDNGEGIEFNVFCYNVQPRVEIDYATGESRLAPSEETPDDVDEYVINRNSGKFHNPDCSGAANMNPENRQDYSGSRQVLIDQGFTPCGQCDP